MICFRQRLIEVIRVEETALSGDATPDEGSPALAKSLRSEDEIAAEPGLAHGPVLGGRERERRSPRVPPAIRYRRNDMNRIVSSLTAAAMFLLGAAGASQASDYRRLTTQWKGPGMSLDIVNGGARNNFAQIAKTEDVTGQSWKMTNSDGWLHLTTEFRGAKMCLDVENGGDMNNFVKLERCENNSGQSWKMMKSSEGGFVRLTTEFRGPNLCLDIVNGGPRNGMAQLTKCEDVSGQLWKME
ncbi:RICIN domain-containing protein [Methylobacterium brachythecii]|nr:RICIN domain-containing protein [Methylobacterium brachythecii]